MSFNELMAEFENVDFSPFIKQDVDESIAASTDIIWKNDVDVLDLPDLPTSPSGSPLSNMPPSPGLTEGYQSSEEPLTPAPVKMGGNQNVDDPGTMETEQWMTQFGFSFDGNMDNFEDLQFNELKPEDALNALCGDMEIGIESEEQLDVKPSLTASQKFKVEMNEEELLALPVKELNTRLKGLPKDFVLHLKQKRRTLKNRGYAQNCRSRRLQQKSDLEKENANLRAQLKHSKQQMLQLTRERDLFKRQCVILGSRVNTLVKSRP